MMLTCRYRAAIICSGRWLNGLTPNLFYKNPKRVDLLKWFREVTENKSIYRENISVFHRPEENDSHQSLVASKHNAGRENFYEFPATWLWRWLHSVFRYCHYCSYTWQCFLLVISIVHHYMELILYNVTSPSFKIAIIRTMKGAKSNSHMRAINMKPNCRHCDNFRLGSKSFKPNEIS